MADEIVLVALVIIIILIFYHVSRRERETNGDVGSLGLIGENSGYATVDGGADLRFATELTSTDEQPYSTPYNADVIAMSKLLQNEGNERMTSGDMGHMYMCPCSKCTGNLDGSTRDNVERLVGNGTFPAFFETSAQFGDYREADREKYFGQA